MAQPQYEKLEMFIAGRWRQGATGAGQNVINPATEEVLARLPHADPADLDEALDAVAKGFKVWRAMAPADRGKILKKAADLMRARLDAIATTLTLEEGKTLAEAKGEVAVAADIFEWFAEEGKRTYGRIIPARAGGIRQMAMQEPVGPVAAFTPWNFPAVTPARKLAAALAAGCSIVIKAAEETPGTCIAMVRALDDAGLPKGVCNLVFGPPAAVSAHLVPSPVIRKISFTGSIPVGKHLAKMAADGMKRATMELGGHSPFIVFDDVEPEKIAKIAIAGKFRNAGQVCISPTRFFVHEKVYSKFAASFAEMARGMKVGNGLDPSVQMGPLANPRRLDAMEKIVGDAKGRGATIASGGKRIGNQGFFWEPTVMTEVPEDADVMNKEPFGPVAPVVVWRDFDDLVARANKLEFGLAAYAFTSSAGKAAKVSEALESGMVAVNHLAISTPETPFGGVKESGYGHEGGIEGLQVYMNTKFVTQQGE